MSSRLLEFKPVPMVVSLRGVKAAARRLRGGLRASLDSSTLKTADSPPSFAAPRRVPALLRIGRMTDTSPPNGNCETQGMYANVNIHIIIDLLDSYLDLQRGCFQGKACFRDWS